MLSTLHDTLHDSHTAWWDILPHHRPQFRFFVVHHLGRIRFFLETPTKHKQFLESQLYAHYSDIEITEAILPFDADTEISMQEASLSHISGDTIKLYANLKDRTEKEGIDPLSGITSVLAKSAKSEIVFLRVDFAPLSDHDWREHTERSIIEMHIPDFTKIFLLSNWWWIRLLAFPFTLLAHIASFLMGGSANSEQRDSHTENDRSKGDKSESKFDSYGYSTRIILASLGNTSSSTRELASSLHIFSQPNGAKLVIGRPHQTTYAKTLKNYSKYRSILSVTELAGLVHMPTIYVRTPGVNWVTTRRFEPPHNLPHILDPNTPIGLSNFRGSTEEFGIQPADRARHTYIIGKTGMGKSTLLENMLYSDIMSGRGIALIDPHGDLADTILANIPKSRTNDIVLFDPSDTEYPIAFNMLDNPNPELRPIVASGLVSIFKKMFAESW